MKLPLFEYLRPDSVDEALKIMSQRGDEAQIIAGGQSLLPMMAFRMAQPTFLVDIASIPDMNTIEVTELGTRIGAMVRWSQIELCAALRQGQPLLATAVSHIAHHQIRQKGTVGGSLALADPAAELPAVAVACNAEIEIAGSTGIRRVPAQEFFLGAMHTALEFDELIIALHMPSWTKGRRHAFDEFEMRKGDFAIAGVAAVLDLGSGYEVCSARIVAFGVDEVPLRLSGAEQCLIGAPLSQSAIRCSVRAAEAEIDPPEDIRAEPAYRRALLGHLLERALARCLEGR